MDLGAIVSECRINLTESKPVRLPPESVACEPMILPPESFRGLHAKTSGILFELCTVFALTL